MLFAIVYGHLMTDLSWMSLGACVSVGVLFGAYHRALIAPSVAVSASLVAGSDGTILSGMAGAMLAVGMYSSVVGIEVVWHYYRGSVVSGESD